MRTYEHMKLTGRSKFIVKFTMPYDYNGACTSLPWRLKVEVIKNNYRQRGCYEIYNIKQYNSTKKYKLWGEGKRLQYMHATEIRLPSS
jgi:hypothetical protein